MSFPGPITPGTESGALAAVVIPAVTQDFGEDVIIRVATYQPDDGTSALVDQLLWAITETDESPATASSGFDSEEFGLLVSLAPPGSFPTVALEGRSSVDPEEVQLVSEVRIVLSSAPGLPDFVTLPLVGLGQLIGDAPSITLPSPLIVPDGWTLTVSWRRNDPTREDPNDPGTPDPVPDPGVNLLVQARLFAA